MNLARHASELAYSRIRSILSGAALLVLSSCAQAIGSETLKLRQTLLADNLDNPQAVASAGPGNPLIAGKSGKLIYIVGNRRQDLGVINFSDADVLGGKGDPSTELRDFIAIPGEPDHFAWCATSARNGKVLWSVGRTELLNGRGRQASMRNRVIWRSEPRNWRMEPPGPFFGCRMAFNGRDLNVAMGAADRHTGSGQIMRISLDRSHGPIVVSTGHRNPGGIVLKAGNLWEVEFGPVGGDELNLIVPGGDYGWPQVSKGQPQGDGQPHGTGKAMHFLPNRPGSIEPVLSWSPSLNPAGMTVWRGKIYISALSGSVVEITTSGNKIASQRRFLEIGDRVRDVRAVRNDQALWILTDGPDARLIAIEPDETARQPRLPIPPPDSVRGRLSKW